MMPFDEPLGSSPGLKQWSERAAALLECDDDAEALAEAILRALEALGPAYLSYISVAPEPFPQRPWRLWVHPVDFELPAAYYSAPLIQFNPFVVAIREGRSGLLTLGEVAPSGFEESEVYRRHYQDFGEADEVQHVITQCRGFTLIAGTGSAEPFADAEISRHAAAHPLIAAGLARLAKLLEPELAEGDGESQGGVDFALEQFGAGVLSERENEVIHLILRGHNSESVASQLGISWNTARRHRTRAYAKLGVTSQGELFYAFLRTLGLEPDES